MTEHETTLHDLLESLRGQWIEAVDLDANGVRLVTSRGAVLHGPAATGDEGVRPDDGRLLGAVLTATTLANDGVLTLVLADADGADPLVAALRAPWVLTLPLGAGIAARADGRIGLREATGPVHATSEAMAVWSASAPTEIELAVLDAAADDWVSPGDVVSALLRSGVTDDEVVEQQGIETLARLLARGDLEAGWIDEEGFRSVPDAPDVVIEHVATVWRALGGRRPSPGQISWFRLPLESEH